MVLGCLLWRHEAVLDSRARLYQQQGSNLTVMDLMMQNSRTMNSNITLEEVSASQINYRKDLRKLEKD